MIHDIKILEGVKSVYISGTYKVNSSAPYVTGILKLGLNNGT